MEITVAATLRTPGKRGAVRRERRAGRVPGIIYGACEPLAISCSAKVLAARLQEEAFRSTLLTIDVEGRKIPALLREVQMHPFRREILHMDFQAVSAEQEISTSVPLHFVNAEESPGVKLHRAIFTSIENQVAIHCLPKDLPEYINVDVGGLDIGQNIHLSEITPPDGVRFDAVTRGEDPALAVMNAPKAESEDASADAAAAPEGEADAAAE